jgi:hypothetical protein
MQQIAAAERGALQGRGRASVVERCAEPAAEKFTSCPAAVPRSLFHGSIEAFVRQRQVN